MPSVSHRWSTLWECSKLLFLAPFWTSSRPLQDMKKSKCHVTKWYNINDFYYFGGRDQSIRKENLRISNRLSVEFGNTSKYFKIWPSSDNFTLRSDWRWSFGGTRTRMAGEASFCPQILLNLFCRAVKRRRTVSRLPDLKTKIVIIWMQEIPSSRSSELETFPGVTSQITLRDLEAEGVIRKEVQHLKKGGELDNPNLNFLKEMLLTPIGLPSDPAFKV